MDISLAGKVALVTGAGSGIGRGVALALAHNGADVVVNDINPDGGQETAEAVRKVGVQGVFIEADVSRTVECRAMMQRVTEQFGAALHVLVNNAGIALFKGIAETSEQEWDKVTDVDLKGIFVVTKAALPLLREAGGSSVINIASVHAHATLSDMTAYAASKGGVVAMTRSLAQELGPFGINVNSISPGFTMTPILQSWLDSQPDPEAELRRVLTLHATDRIGTPDDIGHLVVFLASDYARFIVGANITVDGGLTSRLQH